jgi:hypothetical protein
MKTFTLTSSYKLIRDGQAEVCLRPSDAQIENYIDTFKVYNTEQEALDDIANFINEQRPLLFDVFQGMENIPLSIREQYIL